MGKEKLFLNFLSRHSSFYSLVYFSVARSPKLRPTSVLASKSPTECPGTSLGSSTTWTNCKLPSVIYQTSLLLHRNIYYLNLVVPPPVVSPLTTGEICFYLSRNKTHSNIIVPFFVRICPASLFFSFPATLQTSTGFREDARPVNSRGPRITPFAAPSSKGIENAKGEE